ncbi:MAG: hypothetical protein ABDH18_02700 [Aquificaceae bacterium]
MLRDQNFVFLSARSLVGMFFLASYVGPERSLMLALTLAYASFAVFVYIYPGKLGSIKPYADTIFLIPMISLSNLKEAVFTLFMPVLFYSNRRLLPTAMAFLTLCFFLIRAEGAVYLPLALGLLVASFQPQLVGSALRDRRYFLTLRRVYRDLIAEHEQLQDELKLARSKDWLSEQVLKCQSLDEYLRVTVQHLGLKGVHITPREEFLDGNVIKLRVRLSSGSVNVVFHLSSELQARDKMLLELCKSAASYVSLYLEEPKELRLFV